MTDERKDNEHIPADPGKPGVQPLDSPPQGPPPPPPPPSPRPGF